MKSYNPIPFLDEDVTLILKMLEIQDKSKIIKFPSRIEAYKDSLRGRDGETPYNYLKRIIRHPQYGEEIYDFKVSENFLVFIEMKSNNNIINYCNIQAFLTEDIELMDIMLKDEYELKDSKKVFYYRMDYDINNLGPIFKESSPHIHITPSGNPRINIQDIKDDIVVNFFDFIYRNHFYDKWINWVKKIIPDELGFDILQGMYNKNQFAEIIKDERIKQIDKIKETILMNKQSYYNWKTEQKSEMLNY